MEQFYALYLVVRPYLVGLFFAMLSRGAENVYGAPFCAMLLLFFMAYYMGWVGACIEHDFDAEEIEDEE